MHPTTVIETVSALVFISALNIIAVLVPKRMRKVSLYTATLVTVIIVSFFLIRPHWINYQVSIKKEQLNHYLKQKYPGEKWEITRPIGRQYNPYHLHVKFINEKGWRYFYFVNDAANITQKGYSVPIGTSNKNGKHLERLKHND